MSKYKLKQWYPSLPKGYKEGDVVEDVWTALVGNRYAAEGKISISADEVENNPEFWEEVEEKEYEILKVKLNRKHPLYDKGAFPSWIIDYRDHLSLKYFDIHSVKRLSDGEIFIVGDKINIKDYGNNPYTISSFTSIYSKFKISIEELPGFNTLDEIEHAKEPVFTTEDGVDIYEGDLDFYWVDEESWKPKRPASKHAYPRNTKDFKHFRSQEKAWEYIEEHKPRYSKADIKEALKECMGGPALDITFKPYKFKDFLNL